MSWSANRALFPFYTFGETIGGFLAVRLFREVGVGNSKGGEIGRKIDI